MSNINKNIIKQAGAAVANATNKAAGLSAATPEPGTVISAIQLVNGGRSIGPAALAHFTESVRNKLLSLQVDMDPIQDFNGYDHPWPAGAEKNKAGPLEKGTFSESKPAGTSYTTMKQANDYRLRSVDLIPINGQQATISLSDYHTYNVCIACFDADGLYLGGATFINWKTAPYTINNSSVYYIACVIKRLDNALMKSSDIDGVHLQVELGSTATSWMPYENICPISGRTGLSVYVGPTSTIGDAEAYSMDWTSPAGTVYAGSADIVTGYIKSAPYYASYNGETLVGPWVSSMDAYDPEGVPTTGAQVVDLGGTMTEYNITGQDIITLVGDNYIWSDSGDVTITE